MYSGASRKKDEVADGGIGTFLAARVYSSLVVGTTATSSAAVIDVGVTVDELTGKICGTRQILSFFTGYVFATGI
jgi:hypothetical protein